MHFQEPSCRGGWGVATSFTDTLMALSPGYSGKGAVRGTASPPSSLRSLEENKTESTDGSEEVASCRHSPGVAACFPLCSTRAWGGGSSICPCQSGLPLGSGPVPAFHFPFASSIPSSSFPSPNWPSWPLSQRDYLLLKFHRRL